MLKLIITCKALKDGVVTEVGYTIEKNDNGLNTVSNGRDSKANVISAIEKHKITDITTSLGSKVNIINGPTEKFLRSDGDRNTYNDLLDCPNCPNV